MRQATFALCLSALTSIGGCTLFEPQPFPTTPFTTVAQACENRQLPGASSPAFCQCLDHEARYASEGNERTYNHLIAMTSGQMPKTDMNRREQKVFSNARNRWRVTLQNSALRCAHHAPKTEPFFGFDY